MESKKMLGDVKGISGMTTHHPARPESAHLGKNRELGPVGPLLPQPLRSRLGSLQIQILAPAPKTGVCVCVGGCA